MKLVMPYISGLVIGVVLGVQIGRFAFDRSADLYARLEASHAQTDRALKIGEKIQATANECIAELRRYSR